MRYIFSVGMVLGCLMFADGQVPSMLRFEQGNVYVTGLNLKNGTVESIREHEWKQILPVFTVDAWSKKINQPVAGAWLIENNGIAFKPAFPFSPGQTYHTVFDAPAFFEHVLGERSSVSKKLELTFTIPEAEVLLTSIDAVYPTSQVVPENLLRMYINFSSPMMPGEAYDHIKLLRADGTKVERPFLVIDQELWDAERMRFTLLFDPGRIKRALKSNLDLGTPLKEGETYLLVIDSTWRDINGNYLQSGFTRKFTVATAQRTKLPGEHINIVSPKTSTREEVVLSLDRPIDRLLMSKYVSVQASGGMVSGVGRMLDDFTWAFTPEQEWSSGTYEIVISPWVEDVCGNNFNNVFDLDLTKEKRVTSEEMIKISFDVKNTL